jgi:subtilisin family serine protease
MRERVVLGVWCVALTLGFSVGCSESGTEPAPVLARLPLEADGKPLELPPPPAVPPEPLPASELDRDGNKLDDAIDAALVSTNAAPGTSASLDDAIRVSVFLEAPVTKADVSAFQARGGSVRRFYKKLAYGFQGTLARRAALATAEALGDRLRLIEGDRAISPHLDEATRTGRVRPVWAPGFAGPGFQGSATTTIAIIDTGIDDTHTDLAGRLVLFRDLTTDDADEAEDFRGHGTHVAGIALGTGASFEGSSNTLRYTNSGDVTGLGAGAFFPSPIHLPAAPLTFTSVATWNGAMSGMHELISRTQPPSGNTIVTTPLAAVSRPHTETLSFTPDASLQYLVAVASLPGGVTTYAAANAVTNYPAVGDGFATLRGVAAGSRWAAYKVFTRTGNGSSLDTLFALDELADIAAANDIKVANMSLGLTGSGVEFTTLRAFANALVDSGIVTCVSAGNEGSAGIISDPGRAARVLTVGATNDVNQLTDYTSRGFTPTGVGDGPKPDVLAPGGSAARSMILAADSNDSDANAPTFADAQANDYTNLQGTSMAAPFAAGAAALVIEALESTGVSWSWSSGAQPLLVKMLLAASATETNTPRQDNVNNPTLGRLAAPKDLEEGYGLMNPDAAVEAVRLALGSGFTGATSGALTDRRAWGRSFSVTSGQEVSLNLAITGAADFDVYVYSASPAANGDPVIEAGSANAGAGVAETVSFVPSSSGTRYLMVKRVSGSGSFTLTSGTTCGNSIVEPGEQCDDDSDCCSATCRFEAAETACGGSPSGACDAQDRCNGAGACVDAGFRPPGSPCGSASDTVCDDPDTCSATGVCQANNVSGSCSDDNACNGAEVCSDGACQRGTAPNCNDGNPCTDDSCNPPRGCVNAPNTSPCGDANACNGTEVCNGAGACAPGTPPLVDDGNPCTVDACDAAAGVTHTPVTPGTSCADADRCDGIEICDFGGNCVAGTGVTCTPGDECHLAGSCVSATGACTNPNAPDGTVCSLGTCRAGACTSVGGTGGTGGAAGAGGTAPGGAGGTAPGGAGGTAPGGMGGTAPGGAGGTSPGGAGAGGTSTGGAGTGGAMTGGSSGSGAAGRAGTSAGGNSGASGNAGSAGRGGNAGSAGSGNAGSAGRGGNAGNAGHGGNAGSAGRGGGIGRGGSAGDDAGAAGDGTAGDAGEGDRPSRRGSTTETNGCGCRVTASSHRSGLPLALGLLLLLAMRRRR